MNKIEDRNNEEMEIDLGRLLRAVIDRAWLVAATAVVCAVLTAVCTFFFITPKYKAAAMFYVNNNSFSVGDASLSISSGDLVTSRGLVDSYIVILNTRETLNDVRDYAGVKRTYAELKGMISASAVNETEIFQVAVTSSDPNEAERIANAIAYILPKRIGTIIDGTSAKVVDAAVVPSAPSSPSYTKNTMLGFLLGLFVSVGAVVLHELFDITIRSEEDVTQLCDHPILAAVPDMTAHGKGGTYYSHYYGYGRNGSKKDAYAAASQAKQPEVINKGLGFAANKTYKILRRKIQKNAYAASIQGENQHEVMGKGISFAATEAYKLLRTKIQFSFTDDNECRVIGLSSALSGEGKSLTAVNFAYTLSQLGKKVMLIDCDMRRPTLAEKLGINKKPGLSSYLTGQSHLVDLVQNCNLKGSEEAFHVISAGQNPPNPVELLSSARMQNALNTMRKAYDYIILDLPPVGEVTDALAVANATDGMLLVVRQNYCDRLALSEAVRQFEFIDAKILGTVFNCTSEHGSHYGNGYYKRYHKYYYKRYHRSHYYDKSYAAAANSASAQETVNNKTGE